MAEMGPSPQQIEFLKKTVSSLLQDFCISVSHEVGEHCDRFQVMEIAKKMLMEEMGSLSSFPLERVTNKGIEGATGMMQWNASIAGGPDNVEFEIRERGAIGTVHDCMYKNMYPEFCVIISHIGFGAICQLADPELELLCTHHLTSGDPFCRYVIKKKSVIYKDPDSLGKVIMKLPKVNITDEQIIQFRNVSFAGSWINHIMLFKILQGPEKTMEALGPNAKRIGMKFGTSLIETNMLPARDISVMGGFIHQFGEGFTMKGRISSMAPGVFTKEISECPFKTAPPEICKQFEAFFNGMLERINPNLEFHYDRMMTAGDKTCKWVITKK